MSSNESEGPAWNKFWLSMDHESDSMVSGGMSHPSHTPHRSLLSPDPTRSHIDRGDSVLPNDSASHHGDDSHSEIAEHRIVPLDDAPFPFKFKAPSGRVHRLNVVPSAGIAELISNVSSKLGPEVEAVGGEAVAEDGKLSNTGYALSYLDNEGDTVSITTDQDLSDAVNLARSSKRDKVDLFVHDPEKPPLMTTIDPHPATPKLPSPQEPLLKEKSLSVEENQPQSQAEHPSSSKEGSQTIVHPPPPAQLISGVPNELLLPGAIVTLAAVIAGVFVLNRIGKR